MSNLSDIGFPVRGDEEINEMLMSVLNQASEVRCPPRGFYLKFSDRSGAEIWLQGNLDQELIGFNPHFAGKSRRTVALTQKIERESSDLDGGFHVWANPSDESNPESGEYPFVFDVPDFRAIPELQLPQTVDIQLTAFASNDLKVYADEQQFFDGQESDLKTAPKSFVATGLLAVEGAEKTEDLSAARPIAKFSGAVKEFALRTNALTGEQFYWFLVETLGGEIDVVADSKYLDSEPNNGAIVSVQAWLSGRIV